MKKLALIGAVSALALIGGQAYALDELEVGIDKNVVPVATGTDATAVGISNALNGNELLSHNGGNTVDSNNGGNTFSPSYTEVTKIFAPKYEDESTSLKIGDVDVQVQVNSAELKQVVPNSQFGLFLNSGLYPSVQGSQGHDEHGGSSDPACCALSVYSGAISGNAIGAGNGIFGVNLTTAPANASNISQINVGKVYAR